MNPCHTWKLCCSPLKIFGELEDSQNNTNNTYMETNNTNNTNLEFTILNMLESDLSPLEVPNRLGNLI